MVRHCCLSVEGAIRNAKDLKGCISVDGKTLLTVAEIRSYMRGQFALGREVLPMCNCEGFDFVKGCPGHEKEAEERHDAVMKIAQAICDKEEETACKRFCGVCTDCQPYQDAAKIYEERRQK